MGVQNYPNLRAAANLAATVVVSTTAIPISGATQASFFLLATNANVPASAAIEVRKGGGAWVPAAAGIGLTVYGTLGALNAGGIPLTVTPDKAQAGEGSAIPSWDEARITVTGHATLVVNGLSIQGQVIGASAVDTNTAPSA